MLCSTANYSSIPALFNSIYIAELPHKFTFRFLQSLGFKSSKMRDLILFLQCFGFLDSGGFPTSTYKEFKSAPDSSNFVSICARAVYTDLVSTKTSFSEDALLKTVASLYPNESEKKLLLTVRTVIALDSYCGFYSSHAPKTLGQDLQIPIHKSKQNLNININLPETENEKVYESIFKYLKEILS